MRVEGLPCADSGVKTRAHTGHTRALDTKCDSQVIHGKLNHTVCFQVGIGGGDDQGRWLYVTDHRW